MSNKDYTEVKTVHHVRRLNNSVMGNPAWMITFDDLTFARTMSDTSWSYSVVPGMVEGKTLLFTFTPAGRIRWAEEVTDQEEPVHADYPHEPGTLYDCEACEDECYCDDDYECIHCSTRI